MLFTYTTFLRAGRAESEGRSVPMRPHGAGARLRLPRLRPDATSGAGRTGPRKRVAWRGAGVPAIQIVR